jgi:hypothetical protein
MIHINISDFPWNSHYACYAPVYYASKELNLETKEINYGKNGLSIKRMVLRNV